MVFVIAMRKLQLPSRLTYTVQEAASLLGVHEESLRREIRAGRLVASRLGRKLLIPVENLEEYIKKGQSVSQEAPRE